MAEADNKFDKEKWLAQKKAALNEAYELLDSTTQALTNREIIGNYFDIQSKFDRYSVSNAILIMGQCPDATRLYDAKTWKDKGVSIKKGETGIIILEPGKPYERKDGSKAIPYNAKKVFDISQTTARPMPIKEKSVDLYKALVALMESCPVPIVPDYTAQSAHTAIYNSTDKKVHSAVNVGDMEEIFRNLAREIAFAICDNGKEKFDRETNAFKACAVANILCRRIGIEPEEVHLSRDFNDMQPKDKRKCLEGIRKEVNSLYGLMIKNIGKETLETEKDDKEQEADIKPETEIEGPSTQAPENVEEKEVTSSSRGDR